MKRRRHTPEQIIRKLREAERMLGEGKTIPEAAKELGISEQTYHRWRNQYGGMKANDAKRLKGARAWNVTLKAIVADQALEVRALKEVAKGNWLSPARRRRAVAMVRDRLGVSERWACRVLGQHHSTERYEPKRAEDDAVLRAELRQFSKDRPRWGYRRAHHHLRELGWDVNRKRVRALLAGGRAAGAAAAAQAPAAAGLDRPAQRLRAERPNQVSAFDFQFDQTADGRVLKLLNVVDEFTRESLVMLVERSIDADRTVGVLERLRRRAGRPGVSEVRQRPGDDRARAPGLVRAERDGNRVNRAGLRRGRTRTSRASTPACATSCSMSRSSPAWPRRAS